MIFSVFSNNCKLKSFFFRLENEFIISSSCFSWKNTSISFKQCLHWAENNASFAKHQLTSCTFFTGTFLWVLIWIYGFLQIVRDNPKRLIFTLLLLKICPVIKGFKPHVNIILNKIYNAFNVVTVCDTKKKLLTQLYEFRCIYLLRFAIFEMTHLNLYKKNKSI